MRALVVALALGALGAVALADPPTKPPPPACSIELTTKIVTLPNGNIFVNLWGTNTNTGAVMVRGTDRCTGAIELAGLPAGYDYRNLCLVGGCAADAHHAPLTRTLVPNRGQIISQVLIDPKQTKCNAALPAATYDFTFVPPVVVAAKVIACAPTHASIALPIPPPPPPPKKTAPKQAVKCKPMPACGIGCPGPMAHDENGCTLCACEKQVRPGDVHP